MSESTCRLLLLLFFSPPPLLQLCLLLSFPISPFAFEVLVPSSVASFWPPPDPSALLLVASGLQPSRLLLRPATSFPTFLSVARPDDAAMSERRSSPEDDRSSLLSRLGSDSPRPRMKYGGMFCSIEGAFENKTLNFESFSPQTQRRRGASRCGDGGDTAKGSPTMVFSSGNARSSSSSKKEVPLRFHQNVLRDSLTRCRLNKSSKYFSQKC